MATGDKVVTLDGLKAVYDSQDTDGIKQDISDLKSSFDSALSPTQAENNLCTGFVRGKYFVAWKNGDTVTLTDNANYMAATVPLNGEQYISLNQAWDGNSYCFFADADNKRIALMRDCVYNEINYVYTVPQNAKYAYISQNVTPGGYPDGWLNTIGIVVLARNTSIINYSVADYPYGGIAGVHYLADDLVIAEQGYKRIGDLKSQMVFTCKKDGTGDFDSFVECVNEAVKYTDSIVYVGAGEWDIIDELGSTYMAGVSSPSSTWGLVLKNNIHIIGTSKTIIKAQNAIGSTNFNNIKQYFSIFNAGGNGGFTIENLTLSDENIRYSVHDDLGGSGSTPYINKYINCTTIHKNGYYSDCIGGGIGENANIEIRGCYFEGETGNPRIVYYHGNNNQNVTNAQALIIVCDNYFAQDGTFMLTNYGNSTTKSKAFVSNNSFGTIPSVSDGSYPSPIIVNMELIEWNNIVRT